MTEPILTPSDVVTADRVDNITCAICRRQFSKYTCPTCNIAYCSLTCFRSEMHSQCSESFYRKEVESDIRTEPSRTAEERRKMMELLKRFEEDGMNKLDAFSEDEGPTDNETDLAKRLEGVDLESGPVDSLWLALTPKERSRFLEAFNEPSSELARQLLASEELEKITQNPWWDAPVSDNTESSQFKRYGVKPTAMSIPSSMVKPLSGGPSLIYNLCAIFISYSYTTHYLSSSPLSSLSREVHELADAQRIISKLVPFLTDRKAKTLHSSLSSVVTDIWSRFDLGKMDAAFFAILLRDTAHLLWPIPVFEFLPPTNHDDDVSNELSTSYMESHHRNAVLVLSDLCQTFGLSTSVTGNPSPLERPNHVTHKLMFYTAYVLSIPSTVLRALSQELLVRSKALENEAQRDLADTARP